MSKATEIVLMLRGFLVYTMRVVVFISWFAPFLGVANLLSHWQIEQQPLDHEVFMKYNDTIKYNFTIPFHNLHRSDYSTPSRPIPPAYSCYTIIRLHVAASVFMALVLFYGLLVAAMKWKMSPAFKSAKWYSKFRHLVEALCIPDCYQDWDQGEGSQADYRKRSTAVWKETMLAIFFHSFFSLILLIPMAVTGGSNVLTHY